MTIYKIWTYHREMYYSTRSNHDHGSIYFSEIGDDMVGMMQEVIKILMLDDNMKFNHLMENEGHEGSSQGTKDFLDILKIQNDHFIQINFIHHLIIVFESTKWVDG